MNQLSLPLHPTMRYPAQHTLAGEAVRALYVDRHGRARYPIMGGAPDDPPTDPPKNDPPADPPKPDPPKPEPPKSDPPKPDDLGFPKDTPLSEMTDKQAAAYWKHQSRKHETTWKGIVGDRKVEDVKGDLDEYAKIQQAKLTPSEKAIAEAEQRGRDAASSESLTKAAGAILRAQLKGAGKSDEDIKSLMAPVNLAAFIENGDVDTDRLSKFAQQIAPADTDTGTRRRRDFGGGRREDGPTSTGVKAGDDLYERLHKKSTTGS